MSCGAGGVRDAALVPVPGVTRGVRGCLLYELTRNPPRAQRDNGSMKTGRLAPAILELELSPSRGQALVRDLPSAIDDLCAADDARLLRGKEPRSEAAREKLLGRINAAREQCRAFLSLVAGAKANTPAARIRIGDGALTRIPLDVAAQLLFARRDVTQVLSVLDPDEDVARRVRDGFDALQRAGHDLVMDVHPVGIDCSALAAGRWDGDASLARPGVPMAQAHAAPLARLAALADALDRVARAVAPIEC